MFSVLNKMSINKFGMMLYNNRGESGEGENGYDQSKFINESLSLREFVHKRALLREEGGEENYDAHRKRVMHVGQPINETDAANKLYVDNEIFKTKDEMKATIEKLVKEIIAPEKKSNILRGEINSDKKIDDLGRKLQ